MKKVFILSVIYFLCCTSFSFAFSIHVDVSFPGVNKSNVPKGGRQIYNIKTTNDDTISFHVDFNSGGKPDRIELKYAKASDLFKKNANKKRIRKELSIKDDTGKKLTILFNWYKKNNTFEVGHTGVERPEGYKKDKTYLYVFTTIKKKKVNIKFIVD